jgi:hypothetical protein
MPPSSCHGAIKARLLLILERVISPSLQKAAFISFDYLPIINHHALTMASHEDCLAVQENTVTVLQHAYLVAEKLLKHEKGVHAPGEDDGALQTIYNKDLRTYAIQYVARAIHKVGNGYVDLPVTCVLIKIGQKYPDIKGVCRGVTFRAGFTQLPTLEQLFIHAEMAVRTIRTEYNHKTDSYSLDTTFPSN